MSEARYFMHEYRDLIYEAPIQFPVDLLFVLRAIGMLGGMTTALNPQFSPFEEAMPYARRVAAGQLSGDPDEMIAELVTKARQLLAIPFRVEQLLARIEEGTFSVTANPTPDSRHSLRRLAGSREPLAMAVTGAGMLVAGTQLLTAGQIPVVAWALIASAVLLVMRGVRRAF